MIIQRCWERDISLSSGNNYYRFLETGDIYEFNSGGLMVNQFRGTAKEGSVNNIWLRLYREGNIHAFPLLGVSSSGTISRGGNSLAYTGSVGGIEYQVRFLPAGMGTWFWEVSLNGAEEEVDLIYGQDIGVADEGAVLTNELYMAQYLGHSIFEDTNGYVICSRQNQKQSTGFPYLQQGMLRGRAVGYATDGMQFFGPQFKESHIPKALRQDLPNLNYQFESSYATLQSGRITLRGECIMVFYGHLLPDHPDAVSSLEYRDEIEALYREASVRFDEMIPIEPVRVRQKFGAPLVSVEWGIREVESEYPQRKLEEWNNGKLMSFFTSDHAHVVMKAKEIQMERPHGTILCTPAGERWKEEGVLATTNYMYGLFHGQAVLGNTTYHKLISAPRGQLNLQKNMGQRVYICLEGHYHLLALPSAYEMGMNYARWFYELPGDRLVVTAYTVYRQASAVLEVSSSSGICYDYIVTSQLVMGEHEFQSPIHIEEAREGTLRVRPDADTPAGRIYPSLYYDIDMPDGALWSDDRVFFEDGLARDGSLLTLDISRKEQFSLVIRGSMNGAECENKTPSFLMEKAYFLEYFAQLNNGFHLEMEGAPEELEILNETAWWYTHNAMIHFSSPHGLEQPGGAAWGTRDVCQGPFEFFLATQRFDLCREILVTVFSNQQVESGEWPQWFMFDRYLSGAEECHGDVVLWPLKGLGDYLYAAGDSTLLYEELPYRGEECRESLLCHLRRAVKSVQLRLLEGTALINYAHGDWDDTLQPADPELKDSLVSGWTVILAYQAINQLGKVLETEDAGYSRELLELAEDMKCSFDEILLQDGVIAGFAQRKDEGVFELLLHPWDQKSGIRYRLLPHTRSIISGIVGREQAQQNLKTIEEHLLCPDGARLMEYPARYHGGVSRMFSRAEQAANVGREISLQYTHAHIRYIEALAKCGERKKAWDALFAVNPILIQKHVPNAWVRQSNLYFSSSDGAFVDRYEYAEKFDCLRDGTVGVKGGWRLYSSGPGIYLNQLIGNVLGIRSVSGGLLVDPVLTGKLDGLCFSFDCLGRAMKFYYHFREGQEQIGVKINGEWVGQPGADNPYRPGGTLVGESLLSDTEEIHIYYS